MKYSERWMVVLATLLGAGLNVAVSATAATAQEEAAEATAMMKSYEEQQRAAATARDKDPAWRPACSEVGLIQVGNSNFRGTLKNFCLNAEGDLLACFASAIRVYSPKGELLKTPPLSIKPAAVCTLG